MKSISSQVASAYPRTWYGPGMKRLCRSHTEKISDRNFHNIKHLRLDSTEPDDVQSSKLAMSL
jgi:hypothetical protein